jgi:ABC-2 type transport system permease protein
MDVRSREVKVRLLDEARILSQRSFWKMFNLLLPVVLVLLFGIAYIVIRKRKYTR